MNFITFLSQLEYPQASTLKPEQISWVYESNDLHYLLDWLCENIDIEQNYIGNDSEDNLNPIEVKKIKKEHEILENEINNLRKRQEYAIFNRDQLKLVLEELKNQLVDLKKISHDLDDKNKEVDKLIEDDSIKLDMNTKDLFDIISEVLSERTTITREENNNNNFMSQCTNEIQEIIEIDQTFTLELQKLCEKLFSRNANELSDPNELDEEIGRLKHLYPNSERKYIDVASQYEYWDTYLKVLNDEVSRLDSIMPFSADNLGSKYDQCERKIILIKQEINDKAQRIEEYLNTLADLEVEKSILLVDYNVQSNYQKSFINGLDLVMDLLISQFSRLQFIIQAFNIEFDDHKSLHNLLKDVINELNQRCQNLKDRMKLMSSADFSDPKIEKTVVESNDKMLFSIKKLMNLDTNSRNLMKRNSSSSTFVTYESLKERMSEILQERNNTHNNMVEELKAQYEFMKASEEIEKTLTSLLYKDSYTSELLLTSRKFSDLQNSLRHKTTFLQPKLNLITKDLNLQDHLENKKLLFHRYYTDPVWKN
ncbi:hypothetical protein Glove_103g239 [Diversispora epigaea]|uniref:HAUS augmin-like complex subunit 3 N-terminal domain-containing protein n=1 Tax=Diversispora epigaea TaxID=1348612 RepID=A0A397JD05_9GLOM|nr:hypothetical protein Glove_103g239 [Diversispora epigaea]